MFYRYDRLQIGDYSIGSAQSRGPRGSDSPARPGAVADKVEPFGCLKVIVQEHRVVRIQLDLRIVENRARMQKPRHDRIEKP